DYPSGYLSFLNPDIIGADTEIRVEYEWAPILGGQATFLGARLEYRPNDNFSLGTTLLSQAAPTPGRMPAVGSTPSAHQLWEADLDFKLKPNLGSLWGGNLPVELLFSGELSESNVNPNVFGAAMLEDFSASKQEDALPLGKDNWVPGSNPAFDADPNQEERHLGEIKDEKVKGETVNPAWSSDEITVLILDYDFTEAEWGSAVYALSPVGKDYSNMKYLEVWTRKLSDIGADEDVEVYLDIGLVSEDIDGDGELDTEDANRDGILNPGEDMGIILNIPVGVSDEEGIIYGAGNGRLDTEDLDGDGALDIDEHFSRYLLDDKYREEVETGWYKYTIPLKEVSPGGLEWDQVKTLVKHVRVWARAEGSDWKGQLKFARISISGDRWQVEDLEIKGVNNYEDLDFPNPFEDADFLAYYEKMFGNPKTWEGKWQKESALSVSISNDSGYIEQTYISRKNFSNYRQINFWIYLEEDAPEGELYIRFGSDVEVSYYSYSLPLNSLSSEKWIKIEIPFSEFEISEGIPTFADIKQLRIGLRNMNIFPLPYHVYINDIYLSEVYEQRGQAQRYFARSSFSNYFTLSGEYRKIDPPFSIVGGSSTNNVQDLKKWGISSSFFDFLPFSYSHTEEYSSTLTTEGTDLTALEKDKVLKEIHSYNLAFRLRHFPTLTFKGLNTTSDFLSSDPHELSFEDVYDLSLSYPVPLDFALLPTNIAATFQLKEAGKEVEETFSKDITRKGSLTLPFRPLPNMILRTSYTQSEINHLATGLPDEVPKSRSKELSLSSQLSIFRLTPRFEIKGGNKEEEFSAPDYDKRKVSTNFDTSLTLPFRPAAFITLPDIFSTLGWYLSFGLKREGIYEDTSLELAELTSQFGFTRMELPDGREKLWLEKRTFSLRQTWNPFPFLATSLSYGREEEDKTESYTPYRATVESWPVAELRFNLNETPLLIDHLSRRFFTSSHLILGYSKKN
ncbi:hypothetical protein IBX65_08315, partial [Candidatus Aerophobetes bacterium]|nr:hypothetical protein [Candidatus Aerophobetes bacterium]